jgi:acetyl-CoA acyltransferase
MGLGPIPATEKALAKAGLSMSDIGAIEINEAFAVQVLAFTDHFAIDQTSDKLNAWGGAIAFGHPLASSGIRLAIQLARQFEANHSIRYGITTMCVGLGQGGTMVWENPNFRA